jgi:hypothetical protein
MAPFLISGAIALAKEYLPALVGKVAGDKSGEMAAKVINMASEVTGIQVSKPHEMPLLQDVLAQNPELATQFQTRMAELELETTKAFLGDVQNARARDIELQKAGKTNVRADAMVVSAFVALITISVFMIVKTDVSVGVMSFLTTIGGMLMKNISTAFDFEYGSSRGSKGKSEDMGKLMAMLSKK